MMGLNKFQCWSRKSRKTEEEMQSSKNKANNSVTFPKLFRFASNIDRILIAVSVTACVVHGVTVPFSVILFGNLAKVLIEANELGWNETNTNSTTECQYSYSLESIVPLKYVSINRVANIILV